MKPLHVCVPTLRRYDLLKKFVESLNASTIRPNQLRVIDNGMDSARVTMALQEAKFPCNVFTPTVPMGLAACWNKFIRETTEERVICNDDITFAPTSLEQLLAVPGDIASGLPRECISGTPGNAFSCFLIRDHCIEKIGWFDEDISPGYAYFEDCDYEERMHSRGLELSEYHVGIVHIGSATVTSLSPSQSMDHHNRFQIAQSNFIKKWGRLPRGIVHA